MQAASPITFSRKPSRSSKKREDLSALEHEVSDFFAGFLQLLGLPLSVAQIYGLLYCRENSLSFEEIQRKLCISQGSTSQGLRYLLERSMVRAVAIPGRRHKEFLAETALGRIVQMLLKEQVSPRLDDGRRRLKAVDVLLEHTAVPPELEARLRRLGRWTERAQELLPLMLNLAGGGT
jgi:DNA-binding transcriptional regulator GbsR (MarR family)